MSPRLVVAGAGLLALVLGCAANFFTVSLATGLPLGALFGHLELLPLWIGSIVIWVGGLAGLVFLLADWVVRSVKRPVPRTLGAAFTVLGAGSLGALVPYYWLAAPVNVLETDAPGDPLLPVLLLGGAVLLPIGVLVLLVLRRKG